MRKIKLKKKKDKNHNVIILLIVMIIITLFIVFNFIGKKLTPIIMNYAEKQAKKIAVLVIGNAIDSELGEKFKSDNLFITDGKETNYNTYEINNILKEVSINVKEYLRKLESGELGDIGLSDNENINVNSKKLKKGIIYQVPSGVIFNNGILANLGPKIPVKLSLIGDITTDIVTDIKEYGINNAVIELGVKIIAEEQVILPFGTKQIQVETVVPISIKIINGTVPGYYFNPYTLSSS